MLSQLALLFPYLTLVGPATQYVARDGIPTTEGLMITSGD